MKSHRRRNGGGTVDQCISYIPMRQYLEAARISPASATILGSIQRQLHSAPKDTLTMHLCTYDSAKHMRCDHAEKDHTAFSQSADYRFIDKLIRAQTDESPLHHVSYSGKILGTSVNLHFCIYDLSDRDRIQGWVTRIEQWLNYALLHKSEGCVRDKLIVRLMMSPAEKRVPKSGAELVDTVHANSAFTYSCANTDLNTITIFRKEDWFKTFVHETFHRLGLDFSGRPDENRYDGEIAEMFPGVDPNLAFNTCESYCEIWAQIVNHLFATNTISKFQANIRKDTAFATYQMQKYLKIYGHSYDSLLIGDKSTNKTPKYRENTSAFSYFVLRTALQWNLDSFIKWCTENNGLSSLIVFRKEKIPSYVELIRSVHNNPKFRKFARWVHLHFLPIANQRCSRKTRRQFRMTMMEHVI